MLAAQPGQSDENFFDPSHPGWNERDHRLQKLYVTVGKEYDRLWPDRYASPGGNSPIVVDAGLPRTRRGSAGELELLIPLRCRNLVGSVEVVLRVTVGGSESPTELRQFTGCTSNRTLIAFVLPSPEARKGGSRVRAEVSVLDDSGAILTQSLANLPAR